MGPTETWSWNSGLNYFLISLSFFSHSHIFFLFLDGSVSRLWSQRRARKVNVSSAWYFNWKFEELFNEDFTARIQRRVAPLSLDEVWVVHVRNFKKRIKFMELARCDWIGWRYLCAISLSRTRVFITSNTFLSCRKKMCKHDTTHNCDFFTDFFFHFHHFSAPLPTQQRNEKWKIAPKRLVNPKSNTQKLRFHCARETQRERFVHI